MTPPKRRSHRPNRRLAVPGGGKPPTAPERHVARKELRERGFRAGGQRRQRLERLLCAALVPGDVGCDSDF